MSWFGKKKQTGSKIKEVVYVSKLGNKRSVKQVDKNSATQRKGVRKSFMKRYISIIASDLNVLRSLWKPRVVYRDSQDRINELYQEVSE